MKKCVGEATLKSIPENGVHLCSRTEETKAMACSVLSAARKRLQPLCSEGPCPRHGKGWWSSRAQLFGGVENEANKLTRYSFINGVITSYVSC